MKKIIILVIMMTFYTISAGHANEDKNSKLSISNRSDIYKVQFQSQSPYLSEHEKYNYTTTRASEITYITYFFNLFELVETEIVIPCDGKSFLLTIEYRNGSKLYFPIATDGVQINEKSGYSISKRDYCRFLNFIHALKTQQLILAEEINFEPSGWAKTDIQKAIENGLIPKWNQINYNGTITRLEVCQLFDNLLDKLGYKQEQSDICPFLDTRDASVLNLYSFHILDGKTMNEFCPYDFITKEELAKLLSNTYHLISKNISSETVKPLYKDEGNISDWAVEYVSNMTNAGIFIGNENGEFEPQKNISKEEVVVVLNRLYDMK